MKKNLKLLYFSPTNTTKKIVSSIAFAMNPKYEEIDLTLPHMRNHPIEFTSDDIVIIGVPTYAGRVPRILHECFDEITGNQTLAIFITTYGNRAYEDALLELKDIFESKGFIGFAAGAFVAEHSSTPELATGRPDANDINICKQFGSNLAIQLEQLLTYEEIKPFVLPGVRPYVSKPGMPPMAPDTSDSCNSCGLCAKHCPAGAIGLNNFKQIDAQKCIRCCSCIRICPVSAKEFTHEAYLNFHHMLISNFSKRRCEPELFQG